MNKNILINLAITLGIGAVGYYLFLPPINVTSPSFWGFILALLVIYIILTSIRKIDIRVLTSKNVNVTSLKPNKLIYLVLGIGTIILLINIVMSPLFNADSYASRITVDETEEFTESVPEVDFNAIPLLDKSSSQKLGDRTMGQMSDLVSQYYVSDLYTQITYNEEIIRVTPLEYGSIIKYFTNRDTGVEGYITVNSVNGEAELVRLEEGMKYMPSALFNENLSRKLRFSYPTEIFGKESFEIDNEGNPYWIVPTIKYTGVGLKKEIDGVIILNPVDGKSKKYSIKDIPTWVDHAFESNLIIEQVNNWGEYKNGFWNSIFGQKDVVNTTTGYTYLSMNNDIYLYTGITSVASDQSNLGFILTNLRTKETNYYSAPGAEEYSAMASAEGLVQEKNYVSTFPLLINLENRPTYLMSLKDNAGLVKMYALVDVEDYQKVITSDSALGIDVAADKYLNEIIGIASNSEVKEAEITVKEIKTAVIDGYTYYYFIDTNNMKYMVNVKTNRYEIPFIKTGDKLTIKYSEENEVNVISYIK